MNNIDIPDIVTTTAILKLINEARKASGEQLEKIKEKIKELFCTRKYGFTDSVENAKKLYEISETSLFQSFKKCISDPTYLNLIREGLRVSYLNDNGRKKEIDDLKTEVNKRFGRFGLRIMSIASTGELEKVVAYLVDLKLRKNYNIIDLTKEFEKIVDNWNKITIFVKTEHTKIHITTEITRLMNNKEDIFFVFAYGSAVQNTIESIATLNINKEFSEKYLFEGRRGIDKAGCIHYKCFFETIEYL